MSAGAEYISVLDIAPVRSVRRYLGCLCNADLVIDLPCKSHTKLTHDLSHHRIRQHDTLVIRPVRCNHRLHMKFPQKVRRVLENLRNLTRVLALKDKPSRDRPALLRSLFLFPHIRIEFIFQILQRHIDAIGHHVESIQRLDRSCILHADMIAQSERPVLPRFGIYMVGHPYAAGTVRQNRKVMSYIIQTVSHFPFCNHLSALTMECLSVTHHGKCRRKHISRLHIDNPSFHHNPGFLCLISRLRDICLEIHIENNPLRSPSAGLSWFPPISLSKKIGYVEIGFHPHDATAHADFRTSGYFLDDYLPLVLQVEYQGSRTSCRYHISSGFIGTGLHNISFQLEPHRIARLFQRFLSFARIFH